MSLCKNKPAPVQPEGREQLGAPCPIGVLAKNKPQFNCLQSETYRTIKPVQNRSAKPRAPQNIIKIRMHDVPKDIIIKFGDKETLMGTLKATISLLADEKKH